MRESFTYRGERWRAETSGTDREAGGVRSVGVWFTNEVTSEQIHGDLDPDIVNQPSQKRLVDALDVTLCKHTGLTGAATAAGVQDHDIIATRRSDGRFDLRQRIRGVEHFLEGPLEAADAARRARELAAEEQGDAWIQQEPGGLRLLT